MLRDTVPVLLEGKTAPKEPSVWESTRRALDVASSTPEGSGWRSVGNYDLFAAMIEFGLSRCAGRIVTVTHLCMEHILRRAGRPRPDRRTHTIGKPAAWPDISTAPTRRWMPFG
ncbi:hypothetical protein NKH41_27730 [Mesorhizobium sp. M1169]